MVKMTLAAERLNDLALIFGALTPKEIAAVKQDESIKAITRVQKIFDEMEAANGKFTKLHDALVAAIEPIRQEAQDKIKEVNGNKDFSESERKAEVSRLVDEYNAKLSDAEKLHREQLKFEEIGSEMVEFSLADDKFKLMKELFEKVAPEKFLRKKELTACWEAISEAKED